MPILLQDKDWSHLYPGYKSKVANKQKKKKIRKKKEYNPFPPNQLESNLDKRVTEGEHFISSSLKGKQVNKEEQKKKSKKIQSEKRAKQYIVPEEPPTKKRKVDAEESSLDIDKLTKKIKKQKKKKI